MLICLLPSVIAEVLNMQCISSVSLLWMASRMKISNSVHAQVLCITDPVFIRIQNDYEANILRRALHMCLYYSRCSF
jgi:hypothetical protein